MRWRVGSKIPINVYDENGRPVCQCHTPEDARKIVRAVNLTTPALIAGIPLEVALPRAEAAYDFLAWMEARAPETLKIWREVWEREAGHA